MILSKIRFKGYSWVHNPKILKISKEQNLREHHIPFGKSALQDLGGKARIISGTGQLIGEDCIDQYNQLVALHSKEGSGILSLPDTKPYYAFFKSIELACDPTPQVVTYNFVFVEDVTRQKTSSATMYHTVKNDKETLWDISYKYGVEMNTLVSLNPQIKRIDELAVNERVRVC